MGLAHLPPLAPSPVGVSERLSCSLAAAKRFQVPTNVVLAVATVENGRAGLWVPNSNGSYDLGAMQLNTAYLASLARYGIRADHVLAPGCFAYMLAAWRLHGHLVHDVGDPWQRVANYNSRTPIYNLRYQARLAPAAAAWRSWLDAYYPTMANVGGPELALPTTLSPWLARGFAPAFWPDERRHQHTRMERDDHIGRCAVVRAPIRVEMAFQTVQHWLR